MPADAIELLISSASVRVEARITPPAAEGSAPLATIQTAMTPAAMIDAAGDVGFTVRTFFPARTIDVLAVSPPATPSMAPPPIGVTSAQQGASAASTPVMYAVIGISVAIVLAVASVACLKCQRMRAQALVKTHLVNADSAQQSSPRQGARAGAGTQPAPDKGAIVQMADRLPALTSQI